jgi:hypothetical protein
MPSIDLQLVARRKNEIRRAIRRSSPALLYSGPVGIVIIAVNKSKIQARIGKVLDRMAIVSRGELTASDNAHKTAAAEAYSLAHLLSRGDVLGREVSQAVSAFLSSHYHALIVAPQAVESCVVQLNATPDEDYMAHIGPDGSVLLFDRIMYLGAVEQEPAAESDDKASDQDHVVQEALANLNRHLQEQWQPFDNVSPLIARLSEIRELAPLFALKKRRDIVILDRSALAQRDFDGIFKRLTL